jgi:urease accessory protein
MTAPSHHDWLLWQLADSAFPSGGFAHSGGVEAAFHNGELRTRENLITFLEAALANSGSGSLPFVSAAYDGAKVFPEIDSVCDAFTSNHVANRASRLQGRAFLGSAERAFNLPEISRLGRELADSPAHFAPVFGAIARMLALERAATLRVFLFIQLRGWISSAVRLGIVGPIEAQSIQARISLLAEQTATRCASFTLDDIAQTAPLIDLFQGTQDRLYSRLFQS